LLSSDVQIIDIHPDHVERAVEALTPKRSKPRRALILFCEENRVIHAVDTVKGPSEFMLGERPPRDLKAVAAESGADCVMCVERDAPARLLAGIQSKINIDQTLFEQILAVRDPLRRELGAGVRVYPDPLSALPRIPNFAIKALKLLSPKNLTLMIVVLEETEVWTSAVIRIKNGEANLITTTDTLRPGPELTGDMARDAATLAKALGEKHGKATLGVFMSRAGFEHIIAHPRPLGALAALASRKWIVIHPYPRRARLLMALAPMLKI
jgi:hypothetical protein